MSGVTPLNTPWNPQNTPKWQEISILTGDICLEYQYTKLGRWTYFCRWTPWESSIDVWNTATPNLADKPSLADDPLSTRAEMTCIPLHKTWQMNLLWPMDPQYQSRDDLHTTTQNFYLLGLSYVIWKDLLWSKGKTWNELKFGRWTFFCWWTPHLFGRWIFICQWTPSPTSKTSTWQTNLLWPMDTPDTAEMPWMPVHNTWWTNTLCQMDPPVIEQRCLEYWYTQLGRQTTLADGPPTWWMAISHCYWHLVVKNGNFT